MNATTETGTDSATFNRIVTCTNCRASALQPESGQFAPLWDAGWRWIASMSLYSCPQCPPVVLVDALGRHQAPPQRAPGGGQFEVPKDKVRPATGSGAAAACR
ncbi:hypothetical protein ACFWC5_33595 [Streptomyces sp. NPDC060085]|uniref:hypothetical protein n=1 Tax=Streptomyces sp. NPDC060085 TaxID=3347054 RepID=UPI0036491F66